MKCEKYCQQLLADYLSKVDGEKKGVCIEVGVGTFAFYCVLFARLGFKSIAIEPLVNNQLRQICQEYSIDLVESCLSDLDGHQTLYIGTFQGHDNTNLSSLLPDWWGASKKAVNVPSLTLNQLITNLHIEKISCLKIDVEGAEAIIIRQLEQLPSLLLPEIVMFEYGGGDTKASSSKGWSAKFFNQTSECLKILQKCGYTLGIIVDESESQNPVNFLLQDDLSDFVNLFKSSFQWGNIIIFKTLLHLSDTNNDGQFSSTGETKIINNFISNKSIVFDVGSHIGNWSKTVLENHEEIQLHLFEPVPDNYKTLNNNLADWLKTGNIHLNQIAIANHEKTLTFHHYKDNSAWSTFYRRFEVEKQYNLKPPIELPVITTTIDAYCQQLQINRINFLKIDTEGGELDVLYGAKELLRKGKIDYIQFEYGGTFQDSHITLKQVFEYLQKNKYFLLKIEPQKLSYIPEFLPEYENFEYSNYLAVNERFKSAILGQKPQMLPLAELCASNSVKPRGVIHIGAHEGQELSDYLAMGVERILYIEANPTVFERLQKKVINHPSVQAVCCAIGKENGTVTLHITSMDQSSSILPLKRSSEIYPMIQETEQITVPCKTLDSLLEELNLNPVEFNILNIDIQGAELLALQGATQTLKYIEAINTEVNYEELYAECALIDEIDSFLETYDFERVATTTPYHPSWGDAFYAKKAVITMSTLGKNGRFANQIFQYAFLKIYAQEHNLRVETPSWIGQTIFGHNDSLSTKSLPLFQERTNNIQDAIIPNTDRVFKNVDFWGYFQYNTKYYAPYKEYFRSLYKPVPEIQAKMEQGLQKLRNNGKTVVGIHLRRGDYGYQDFFIAPTQWYLEWLNNIWSTLDKPILFIASDEIDKVKQDFNQYNPVIVSDLDCKIPEADFYPDFYLLSKCDILAISNSSFSFAASMLNEQGKLFMRPHLPSKKLISFDPWSAETIFRDAKVEHYQNQKPSNIKSELTTPVVFLIFNRPDTTARVFEAIRQAKPPKLLVVADGARADHPGEAEQCAATRAIINQVDWECEVLTNYSDANLGCRKRVSSGLDWVFEQVEEAIILEDDCLPHSSFFQYCQELLEKYRDDELIMMISGNNFQFGSKRTEYDYYFSRYGHCWGWASWRRAWTKYDDSMQSWSELKNSNWLDGILQNEQAVAYWSRIFQGVCDGFNTWDYIWLFTLWANNGLTILPHVNLVSNIGFGSGTHTTMNNSPFANMPVASMNFPLKHPVIIQRNAGADDFTEQTQFSGATSQSSQIKTTQAKSRQSEPKCKICDSNSHYFATAKVLQKYNINYFQCSNCGFVQTEEPYWLDEAYSEAIAVSDVGLVYRNNMMANIASKLLFNYFDHEAKFLDYGGGYGLFVRLMRDRGFDFYWFDKFCKNVFARGFDFQDNQRQNLELITAFELFEHLSNPVQELEEILNLCPNILFSTELLPEDNPTPDKWWYYTPHEGQHISIFTRKSLEILASRHNLKLYSDGRSLHLLTTKQDLPANLFEELANSNLQPITKNSLLSHDFNQVVNNLLLKNREADANKLAKTPEPKQPIIIIDGVFFQLYQTGIARVWKSLLEEWANSEFREHILVLDRASTAAKISGIRYRTIPAYSYNNTDVDREMLQQVCDEEGAELFISTYYTTPIDTPSVFMAYDMIPEVVGADLSQLMWQEKHKGMNHASAFIAISKNTAQDITKFFPDIPSDSISVAHCGVDPLFSPASDAEINAFKYRYGINKPYFLLGSLGGYKNSILFFQAFAQLANKQGFDIVATGTGRQLPPEWRQYTAGCTVHGLQLTDEELRLAYAGAVALVYPSKYEGFGMPLVEAMACGCPVITCANGSIPEVAGEAAIYVNDDDVEGMVNAIYEVQKLSVRNTLIFAGLQQAKQFSWSKMADTVSSVLINTTLLRLNLKEHNFIIFPDWSQPEESVGLELQEIIETLSTHPDRQKTTLLIDTSNITVEDAELFLYSVAMNLFMSEDSDITEELEIALVGDLADIQWKALLPRIQARIVLKHENQEALEKSLVKKLPYLEVEKFQLSKV